jgi:hypothetical protein
VRVVAGGRPAEASALVAAEADFAPEEKPARARAAKTAEAS